MPKRDSGSDLPPAQLTLPLPELDLLPPSVRPPPAARRVFCNRPLRLDRIEAVGFDMDYTLARYRPERFDALIVEFAMDALIARGYPESIRTLPVDHSFPIRGLLVDLRLGNVLKMDRYKYVKRAFHGTLELSREQRRAAYHTRRLRPSSGRYVWADTLLSAPEVSLLSALIDAFEHGGELEAPRRRDYATLFRDIRGSVDDAQRNPAFRARLIAAPQDFIERDPLLGPALHRLRSAGKRLFLLTNADPEITASALRHALPPTTEYPNYARYFDWIVTDAQKPSFFAGRAPFRPVMAGGAVGPAAARLERGRAYAGGNLAALEAAMGVSGDRVLYVGDHLHGDVLRAKKESAWRTMMIIQEMDNEIEAMEKTAPWEERLRGHKAQREGLQDAIREQLAAARTLEAQLADEEYKGDEGDHARIARLQADRTRRRRMADRFRARLKALDVDQDDLETRIAHAFHPAWGSLFKEETELSSFGHQVEVFACLYTSRVSNLSAYSPVHFFRGPRDRMPHERHEPGT